MMKIRTLHVTRLGFLVGGETMQEERGADKLSDNVRRPKRYTRREAVSSMKKYQRMEL